MTIDMKNSWQHVLDQVYGGLALSDSNRLFCELMRPISSHAHTQILDDEVGSFFLFTTLPDANMPSYSKINCFSKKISFEGNPYGCMYAGFDSTSIGEAIRQHLFSDRTILMWRNKTLPTRPGSLREIGRIPLDGIDPKEWVTLTSGAAPMVRSSKVDYYKQARDFMVSPPSYAKYERMANGINISEPQWKPFKFAAIIIALPEPICKLGRQINRDFERVNHRPPLNKQSL